MALLEEAGKKGYVASYYYLGLLNGQNINEKRKDCKTAVTVLFINKYLKTFVEMANWHDQEMIDATVQYHNGNLQTSFAMFLVGSERGYMNAQVNSALMLDRNIAPMYPSLLFNLTKNWDYYSYALPLYLRAANQGHVDSRVRVGDYYFYGLVPNNNSNSTANISLSIAHEIAWYFKPNTNQVPSYEHALAHYSAAAGGEFAHSSIAMYNLGYMYEYGFGVQKDYHLAKRWYDLSMSTNPSAFLPIQICLTFLNLKWFFQDLVESFSPPEFIDDHPPMPILDDETVKSRHFLLKILEPVSFILLCISALYLFSYRQRVLPRVDEILRQARDNDEQVPLLGEEVDLNRP